MSLPTELLDQASMLVRLDALRPKVVNLRRGVSSAYYAVFHLLIEHSVRRLVGTSGTEPGAGLRQVASRGYEHGKMRSVCEQFAGTTRRNSSFCRLFGISDQAPHGQIPPELVTIAQDFVGLQEARHRADYDLAYRPSRQDALQEVQKATQAFAQVGALSQNADPVFHLFLAMLLTDTGIVRPR